MKFVLSGFARYSFAILFLSVLLSSCGPSNQAPVSPLESSVSAGAVGGGVDCSSVPVWQNNGTLYMAGSLAVDPANNSQYRALVTCWGYNGEPSTTSSIWTFVGTCGGGATLTPTYTQTATATFPSTSTPTRTATQALILTATNTGTSTFTSTRTATPIPSATYTLPPSSTSTSTPTSSFTATPTVTPTNTGTKTFTAASTATSTATNSSTAILTATSTATSSGACNGVAVWQNNSTLYYAGTLAVDPANNGEYKALVTCWGYNGEPSASPGIWSYVGPCGSTGGNTSTATSTATRTSTTLHTPTATSTATMTATVFCGSGYPSSYHLNVTLMGQQESEWCWAASSAMEMNFFGVNVGQCTQATAEYGTSCCVADQCDYYVEGAACNPYTGGWVDIGNYGFSAQGACYGTFPNTGTTLTFTQIEDQIACRKTPYIFAWNWAGGGGHVLVVVGYSDDPVLGQMVEVDDPLPDCQGSDRFMTYGDYVGETNGVYYTSDPDGGEHSHQCDIYNVTLGGS